MQHVPYSQMSQAYTDVFSGRTEIWFTTAGGSLPHVNSGKVRALAVNGPARSKLLPELPTMIELGINMKDESSWYGFFAPKGTPKAIIDKINRDLQTVIDMPDMRERELALGYRFIGGPPERLADHSRPRSPSGRSSARRARSSERMRADEGRDPAKSRRASTTPGTGTIPDGMVESLTDDGQFVTVNGVWMKTRAEFLSLMQRLHGAGRPVPHQLARNAGDACSHLSRRMSRWCIRAFACPATSRRTARRWRARASASAWCASVDGRWRTVAVQNTDIKQSAGFDGSVSRLPFPWP